MERAEQGSNLHRISLRMKYPGERNNMEDLHLRKSILPTDRQDA
jgi:hypothetical protein